MIRVAVIMPVYNAAPYIRDAVASVLAQRFTEFELIIVDDGSTDDSMWIVRAFDDARIRILTNDSRRGLSFSVNRAIDETDSIYIARMDADDIMLPERLERQVSYLDAHPAVGVCGSCVRLLGRGDVWTMPADDAAIRAEMLFNSPLLHPTVLLRRSALAELRYDEQFPKAQDYDLWQRLAGRTGLANVPEVLLEYRLYERNTDAAAKEFQAACADRVRVRALEEIGVRLSAAGMRRHRRVALRQASAGVIDAFRDGWYTARLRGAVSKSPVCGAGVAVVDERRNALREQYRGLARRLMNVGWRLGRWV